MIQSNLPHPWNLSPVEALGLQQELRGQVQISPLAFESVHSVGGLDASFRKLASGGEAARAAAVVLSFPELELIEMAIAEVQVTFPYLPGLLAFRELPALWAALEKLRSLPDVILCDGQGLAHPRRFGLACHLGVMLDRPSVGCAKTILIGKHAPLGELAGSTSPLMDGEQQVGTALRTRSGARPVYVSIGHQVDLPSAVQLVFACVGGCRLPEPTRLADRVVRTWGKTGNGEADRSA